MVFKKYGVREFVDIRSCGVSDEQLARLAKGQARWACQGGAARSTAVVVV